MGCLEQITAIVSFWSVAFGARKIQTCDLILPNQETSEMSHSLFLFILFLHGIIQTNSPVNEAQFSMGGGPWYGSHGSILSVDAVQVRFVAVCLDGVFCVNVKSGSPQNSHVMIADLRSEQKRITCCGNALFLPSEDPGLLSVPPA